MLSRPAFGIALGAAACLAPACSEKDPSGGPPVVRADAAAPAPDARPPDNGPFSSWVFPGAEGKLEYKQDDRGNQVPDFSNSGYGGGGVPLPAVPVVMTLSPVAGAVDDGPRIQSALNAMAALPLDANGRRGALLLTAGLYRIAGSVSVTASGIVLRGEGQGDDGTVLLATGATQRSLVILRGSTNLTEVPGSRRTITDDYVPVGARSFHVEDPAAFAVGDNVIVHRPTTQEWIDFVGMDACTDVDTVYDTEDLNGVTCLDNPWMVDSKDLRFDRIITAIEDDLITVDAPIVNALDREFGGGTIYKYTANRISEVAVENMRGDSEFVSPDDEMHGWNFIEVRGSTNAWVRDITAIHYGYAAVTVVGNSKWVTVQDSTSLEPVSQIIGGRRYTWNIDDSQMVLFQRNVANTGRHDFVQGSNVPGPNVFLDGTALDARDDIGPHHRWSAGGLYDRIVSSKSIRIQNRGNSGTGHGWSGASMVVWNSKAPTILVHNPPGAQNWAIGCQSVKMGTGIWDSVGLKVFPSSLYLQQLKDRLGEEAVNAITAESVFARITSSRVKR